MSFKTCHITKSILIDNDITIGFNLNKLEKIEKNDSSLYLVFPEFRNLTVYSKSTSKSKLIEILNNYISPEQIKRFKQINKKVILTDTISNFIVETITYNKYFSEFLPPIPLIQIEETTKTIPNSCIFINNNEPIGIQLNSKYIIPFLILFKLLHSLCINDGVYLFQSFKYDILQVEETIEITKTKYYLSLNESNTINNLSKNDIIISINSNEFNKYGRIFSPELQLYLPLNLYLMLNGSKQINLEYAIYSKLLIQNYNMEIYLNKFTQEKLSIPICINTNKDSIIKFRGLEFTILTEKIMEEYKDCPINQKLFENNKYSDDKYIVLTNYKNNLLYVLKKISNKKFVSFDKFIDYISQISDKHNKTFYFERYDATIKIKV